MEVLVDKILFLLGHLDYSSVFALMTLESSFVPFPSEIIVPPAAYNAFQGELNIFMVILVGTLGSLAGAIINYMLALYLGRTLIYRVADHRVCHFLLIDSSKVQKAENFFLRWGRLSTFVGRLVPGVRQLISLPAGFSKMNFAQFCLYTVLGAGIWVAILGALGYYFGANQQLIHYYINNISTIFLVVGVIVVIYMVVSRRKRKRMAEKRAEES